MKSFNKFMMCALASGASLLPAHGAYTLSLTSNGFKNGVVTANLNGAQLDASGYKRGFTTDGWTVDRYGDRGYVALSPTFHHTEESCENLLQLPLYTVQSGDVLRWDARSGYPDFPDSYIVRITSEDKNESHQIFSSESAPANWTSYAVALEEYAGKKVYVEFVCNSAAGYLLALDNVSIAVPDEPAFFVTDNTSLYFGSAEAEAGKLPVKFEATNLGAPVKSGRIVVYGEGELTSQQTVSGTWATGETRSFELSAPAMLNQRTYYEAMYEADGADPVSLCSRQVYTSHFKRRLVADKGTGMWCNNCPAGIIALNNVARTYGPDFISIDTHVNDALANSIYYNDLGFSAIPYMMLNRIKSSASTDGNLFKNYIYREVTAAIDLTEVECDDNRNIRISVRTRMADDFDNITDRYRVGYVVTADIADNVRYYQENSCSQPSSEQYYYLPSTIPNELVKFHNVSLTYDDAFEGMHDSMPMTISAGETYEYSWSVDCPRLVPDPKQARVVVYILDSESGEILNADAAYVGADLSAVTGPIAEPTAHKVNGLYNASGMRLGDGTSLPDNLPAGLYILNGKKILVK